MQNLRTYGPPGRLKGLTVISKRTFWTHHANRDAAFTFFSKYQVPERSAVKPANRGLVQISAGPL